MAQNRRENETMELEPIHPDELPTVLKPGFLQDVWGNGVLGSCENCDGCSDESDGPEYGPPWYVCHKKPHMSNLRGFPFKTAQKCCELAFYHFVDWDAVHRNDVKKHTQNS